MHQWHVFFLSYILSWLHFVFSGETVVYDPSPLYELFFGQVLSNCYSNPSVAFDTIMFIQDNREVLTARTHLLTKYFPNIIKVRRYP